MYMGELHSYCTVAFRTRKRLKHILVDSVFDADSKCVISFDTDRSLLIEMCGIPAKKAKNDDPRIVCLGISQVANVF